MLHGRIGPIAILELLLISGKFIVSVNLFRQPRESPGYLHPKPTAISSPLDASASLLFLFAPQPRIPTSRDNFAHSPDCRLFEPLLLIYRLHLYRLNLWKYHE